MSKKFMMLSTVCATIMLSSVLPVFADNGLYCCYEYNSFMHYDSSNCCFTHNDCAAHYNRAKSGSAVCTKCAKAAARQCSSRNKAMTEHRTKGRIE